MREVAVAFLLCASVAIAAEPREYSNAGGKRTFTSGPLAGNHRALLSETKVGLSSKPDTKSYDAVCHHQR